jgi:hypothetical protein
METMKANTGTLSRLEFCYLDVAHYLFDRGNWRWRLFCLDTHSQYLSEKNVERTVNSIALTPSLLVSRARRLAINTKW